MTYTTVLFDLDHTLLDSDASERLAFEHALAGAGVTDPGRYFPAYDAINRALWARVERGEIHATAVRVQRFAQLLAGTGIDVSPESLADAYASGLGTHGELYPGVLDVLDALDAEPSVSLALVTIGLSDVQRARIDRLGLGRYFDAIAISAELGTAKPAPAIFEFALAALGGPARASALIVGDSLSSDIQGGRNAGIATCWYNPHRRPCDRDDLVDHEIAALDALLSLVRT